VSLQQLPKKHSSLGPKFLPLSRPCFGTNHLNSPHRSSGYARSPRRLSKFEIILCPVLHLLCRPPYPLQACSSFLLAGSYEQPYGGCTYVGYSYQLPCLLDRILIFTYSRAHFTYHPSKGRWTSHSAQSITQSTTKNKRTSTQP
jgi:hypothetical protein